MFELEEVEAAFRHYWHTGMIREDWNAWADLFTEDVVYDERVLGTMHGRETVRAWIVPLMEQYGEIYGIYDWHHADPSGRVVFRMINRRDHPAYWRIVTSTSPGARSSSTRATISGLPKRIIGPKSSAFSNTPSTPRP